MVIISVGKTHYVTRYNALRNGATANHSITAEKNAMRQSVHFFQIMHVKLHHIVTHYNVPYLQTSFRISFSHLRPETRFHNLKPNSLSPKIPDPSLPRP